MCIHLFVCTRVEGSAYLKECQRAEQEMAHRRETLIFLYRQLTWKQKDVTCFAVLSQCLSSLPLWNSELFAHLFWNLLRRLGLGFCVRTVSLMVQFLQILQLEADINASCPALGFEAPLAFGRARIPGFSIVPTALKPSGFGSGTTASLGRLDATFLSREMSNSLSHGRLAETVHLFDDWMRLTDAAGDPNKPNILAYNLLLHAKLCLGAHADSMYQVIEEMESGGIIPRQLTYNFVVRSIFQERDSRLAKKILET